MLTEPLQLTGRQQPILVELHASSGRTCRFDAVSPNRARRGRQQGCEKKDGERERFARSSRSCDGNATTTRRTITVITCGETVKHNKRPSRYAYDISARSALLRSHPVSRHGRKLTGHRWRVRAAGTARSGARIFKRFLHANEKGRSPLGL